MQSSIEQLIGEVEDEGGNAVAAEQLFHALYDELHVLAERQFRRSGPELTLGATTLLHESYLHLAGREGVRFPDRARFMGYAARAMRCLIIDYARRARGKPTVCVRLAPAVRAPPACPRGASGRAA